MIADSDLSSTNSPSSSNPQLFKSYKGSQLFIKDHPSCLLCLYIPIPFIPDFMQAFELWDVNGSGLIDPANMQGLPSIVDLKKYDSDDDGLYTKDELMAALSVPAPTEDDEELNPTEHNP